MDAHTNANVSTSNSRDNPNIKNELNNLHSALNRRFYWMFDTFQPNLCLNKNHHVSPASSTKIKLARAKISNWKIHAWAFERAFRRLFIGNFTMRVICVREIMPPLSVSRTWSNSHRGNVWKIREALKFESFPCSADPALGWSWNTIWLLYFMAVVDKICVG